MSKKKKNPRQPIPAENEAEIQQRWEAMRTPAARGVFFFGTAAVLLLAYLRYAPLTPNVVAAVTISFQICCVFTFSGLLMMFSSWAFGKAPRRGRRGR